MQNYTEFVGYAASIIVLISFTMKSMKTLRIVNVFGCGLFVAYGTLLASIPIIFTNVAICCIHLFYLIKKEVK